MKKLAPLYAAAFLAVVVVLGAGWFFLLNNPAGSSSSDSPGSLFGGSSMPQEDGVFGAGLTVSSEGAKPAVSGISPEAPPLGFDIYRSKRYSFSLFHEEGARATEFDENGKATTITIEDEARGHALQIYILPYSGASISEERFRKDLPSGVRTDEEMIYIQGIPAVAFISEVSRVGKTREVWFIRNGHLYELSVPIAMEGWLQSLIPNFRFF